MEEDYEGRVATFLPILMLLPIFLGSRFIARDFHSMPTIVAFLIALLVAFVQNREPSFVEKIKLAIQGVGDENIIIVCLIFLAIGAFTGAVKATGSVDSTINLGLSVLPSNMAVAGLFLIGRFISVPMGAPVGTVTALTPIVMGINQKTRFSMVVCAGTVVGGAMFGDSLSMIPDATVAAVKTQGCEMEGKFRENFLIVSPATIVTILSLLALGKDASFHIQDGLNYSLLRVVPYMVVLASALAGVNVFLVPITGTVSNLIAGAATGAFGVGEIFTHVGAGITGMYDIAMISVTVACIVALVEEYGGITFVLSFTRKRISGGWGGELGIVVPALLVDTCTASNTMAIVTAGPTAKGVSDDSGVTPRHSVSLLDVFSSIGQGLIPCETQLLAAVSPTGLTPFEIVPYCFYPILVGIGGLLFIFIKKRHGKILI